MQGVPVGAKRGLRVRNDVRRPDASFENHFHASDR